MATELILLLLLLLLSAAFSASETALFSVDQIRMQTLAQQKNPKAILIRKLRNDPKLLLGTILLGNNAANVAASALATVITIKNFGEAWIGVATGILTFALLIFSEFIPKSFAAHRSEQAAFLFAWPIYVLTRVFSPLVNIIIKLVDRFTHGGIELEPPSVSEEEIKTMATVAVKAGTLEKEEAELIQRVFLFNDITAEDVMTPREDVEFFDGNKSVAGVLPTITETKYSRFPVFELDEDNLLGIVHVKEIFDIISKNPERSLSEVKVKELVSKVMYVPETKPIDDLFRDFQKHRASMAIVVNEYGTMVGLVTVDDLLEELVGEISDDSDVEENIVRRVDKNTIIAHGDAELKDINRFLNTKIFGPPNKTISRLILEQLGDLPTVGQRVQVAENVDTRVEEMEKRRIMKVRVEKKT